MTHYDFLNGKIVLITGGLGTIGSALVEQLLSNPHIAQIRILDNRETELGYKMYEASSDKVRYIYGDIREKERMRRALHDVDYVYHAAAMKHVPVCEYNPFDAVHTNIIGTQNMIELSLEMNVESFTLISTDKAVNPTNTMGATKLIGERLVHSMYWYRGNNRTLFSAVRFGNVLNSRGSVLDLRNRQRQEKKSLTVTDPDMTRFFMKIEDAARLVIDASLHGSDGEIFILKMPSMKIGNLLDVYRDIYDISKKKVEIIGSRPGEKKYEELILDGEQELLYEDKKMFAKIVKDGIAPQGFTKSSSNTSYSSQDFCLSHKAIKKVLTSILT